MLKGRDIVLLMVLATRKDDSWTIQSLADELEIPIASVQRSIRELERSGTLINAKRSGNAWVVPSLTRNLLVHGIRPNFPPVYLGENMRGVATGRFAPPLKSLITSSNDPQAPLVWPYAFGQDLGIGVEPLHESVPRIAVNHPEPGGPGALLALVDAIRYGHGPRLLDVAADQISQILDTGGKSG